MANNNKPYLQLEINMAQLILPSTYILNTCHYLHNYIIPFYITKFKSVWVYVNNLGSPRYMTITVPPNIHLYYLKVKELLPLISGARLNKSCKAVFH
jgi:hypothetical protein